MVESFNFAIVFPRHGHVFEELKNGVRHVFEGAEVDAFVATELARRHVGMVTNYFAEVFWGKVWFGRGLEGELARGFVTGATELFPLE